MTAHTKLWLTNSMETHTEADPHQEIALPEETASPTGNEDTVQDNRPVLVIVDEEQPIPALEMMTHLSHEAERWDRIKTALEAYTTLIADSLDRGGLSKETALAISVGLDTWGVGLNTPTATTGLEVFAEDGSRQMATQLSLESFTKNMKRVGEAILKALQKLVELLSDFWDDLFNRYARHRKALVETLKAVDELPDTPEHEFFEVSGAEHLCVRGKLSFNVKESLDNLLKAVIATNGTLTEEMLKGVNRAGLDVDENLLSMQMSGIAARHYSAFRGDTPFPGDYRFVIEEDHNQPFNTSFRFEPNDDFRAHLVGKRVIVDTPSKKQLKVVLEGLIKITDQYVANSRYRRLLANYQQQLDALERKYKEATKSGSMEAERVAATQLSLARKAFEFGTRPTRDFNRYLNATIGRFHALIKHAMAQY